MKGKKIDDKIIQSVIKAHKKGMTRKAIANQFGIGLTSVGRIVRGQASTDSQAGEKPRANAERIQRIEALEKRILALEKKILEFEARKQA